MAEEQAADSRVDRNDGVQSHAAELDRALSVPLAEAEEVVLAPMVRCMQDVPVPLPVVGKLHVANSEIGPADRPAGARSASSSYLEVVKAAGFKGNILAPPVVAIVACAGQFQHLPVDPASVTGR